MKELNPKVSRYLILIVIIFFVILGVSFYCLFSSEKLTKFAIKTAIEKYLLVENLSINCNEVNGSVLSGIKIERIDIKHVKPNFEAVINGFIVKPSFGDILNKGAVQINGHIDSLDYTGTMKIPLYVASVPAFLGYGCFAGLPGNVKINSFNINEINLFPFDNKELYVTSNNFSLKSSKTTDSLDILSEFVVNWKRKILAKSFFSGIYDFRKNKLNGKLKIDAAKQIITSELSLAKGKKYLEVSGYIASDTIVDFMPLSQWLGYLWQLDYPYGISGKISCQGSWLYNPEIGFLGNLNGKYEKIDLSFLGLFISVLELNGDWKLFDGSLSFIDTGSKLLGFPATLNGKIESLTKASNRKWSLSFISNSLPLDKVTSSIPWMVKYSNGIPDLGGVATLSVELLGNRPKVNAKFEIQHLSQISKKTSSSKTSGKALYILPEKGSGVLSGDFVSSSNKGLPIFFKRFSRNFYEKHNDEEPTKFKYILTGNPKEKIKLSGSLIYNDGTEYGASGEFMNDYFNLRLVTDDNRVFNANIVDPNDLLLMR